VTARDRRVIVIVAALAVLIGAWLLVIGPKRSQASKLQSQIDAAQTDLNSARAQIAQAQAARRSFSGDYAELVRLGEAVPPDDNVPSLLVQLQRAAAAAHVDFRNLALVPGSATTPTPAPTPSPSPSGSSSSGSSSGSTPVSTSSPSTSASSSTPSSSTPGASASTPGAATADSSTLPPGAAVGPAGFPTEQFTLTFRGNFFHLSDFFRRLDSFVTITNRQVRVSGRLMTLNAISLGASPNGFPQMDATVSATTYLVPAAQGLLNGATTSGPAAAASPGQAVSQTSSPSSATSAPPTAVAAP
jgi:type II secretory pathway pseudopilin PulG